MRDAKIDLKLSKSRLPLMRKRLSSVRKSLNLIGYGPLVRYKTAQLGLFRNSPTEKLKLKPYGIVVHCRPNTNDLPTLKSVFCDELQTSHFPLFSPKLIVDWGCNAGYSSLWYALHYPDCQVIGVEMDAENWRLANENCQNHSIDLVNCAIAAQSGIVSYSRTAFQQTEAFSIHSGLEEQGDKTFVASLSPIDFFKKYNLKQIDFLKIDIEGEEWHIFHAEESLWLDGVMQLHVELHGNRDASPIVNVLADKGFKTAFRGGKTPAVFAVRERQV